MPPRPAPSPRSHPAAPPAAGPAWGGIYARHRTLLLCALIFLVTLLAYWPALHGGFIWDDDGHVTRADLRSLGGLFRIWFEIGATQQYYPVLHSAFWLEHRLWGDAAFGYHLLNVLLHATAACLFMLVLRRLWSPVAASASEPASFSNTGAALLAALLFALHPVCVESVAWISEQKNTLSLVFYLTAALAYLRFAQGEREVAPASSRPSPSLPAGNRRYYLFATALFVLALLTKTVTATLPAALLVVFWWKRGRLVAPGRSGGGLAWRRDVLPLLPWFAFGAVAGLFTAHLERELIGAQGADFMLDAVQRLLLAARIFWFYLGKLAWPAHLTFIYPRWTIDASTFSAWLPPLAALALLAALVVAAVCDRRFRAPLAALLLFAGALFPVLGFFNVFPFVFSYVADHFQYLASLPILALAAAALVRLAQPSPPTSLECGGSTPLSTGRLDDPPRASPRVTPPTASSHRTPKIPTRRPHHLTAVLAVALLAACGARTFSQCRMYRDATTLYETTLRQNPDAWLAAHNLAIIYASSGRVPDAVSLEQKVLQLRPNYPLAENNLGDDLLRLGRPPEAIPHLERAIQLQPAYAVAHRNLGLALAMTGRVADALPHFQLAARLAPADAEAELDWAMALLQTGQLTSALPHFERTLALNPNSADAHAAFAQALHQLGRETEARAHLAAARRLQSSP